MKKITLSLFLWLIALSLQAQNVPDLIRTTPIPATGANKNNRATVDANLKAALALNIPHFATNTLNGSKDSIGYIGYNTTSNRFVVYRGGGVWDSYATADDIISVGDGRFVKLTGSTSTGRQTIQTTSEHLRLAYDPTHYFSTTVASNGSAVFGLTGTVPAFVFNSIINSGVPNNSVAIASNTTATNSNLSAVNSGAGTTNVAEVLIGADTVVSYRVGMRGSNTATPQAGSSYTGLNIGTQAVAVGTGAHDIFAQQTIKPLSIIAGTGSVNTSATLYLSGAATGAADNYNLWLGSGTNRIDGNIQNRVLSPLKLVATDANKNLVSSNISITQLTGASKEVQYPSDFGFRPFSMVEKDGKYYPDKSNSDILKYKIPYMKPYYADYVNGSNSNDGLTPTTPVKTVTYAIVTLGARLLYVAPGIYKNDNWTTISNTLDNDLAIICNGPGKAIFSAADTGTPTWTSVGSGTYSTPLTLVNRVVDTKYTNTYGYYQALTKTTSIAASQALAGSSYIDQVGDIVYVHTTDGRLPDASILLLKRQSNCDYRSNNGYLYVEGVTFMGGNTTATARNRNGSFTGFAWNMYNNCDFIYGGGLGLGTTGQGEGFVGTNANTWMENCVAYADDRDGFNYLQSGKVIEVSSQGHDNGGLDGTNTVNGSSAHAGISVLRINGKYYNNYGPNVIDVQTDVASSVQGVSVNYGVEAFNSLGTGTPSSTFIINADFAVGDVNSAGLSKMYVINGKSSSNIAFGSSATAPGVMVIDTTTTYKGTYTSGVTFGTYSTAPGFSMSYTPLSTYTQSVLSATNGGTGQSVYAVGDILTASSTTALSKVPDIATGNALLSGGVGVVPSYGKIGLTTHVSGTLPAANGGTGIATYTAGNYLNAATTTTLQQRTPAQVRTDIGAGTFTLPAFTSGSALFSDGTTIAQDNTNYFWDNTNKRMGIGTNTPAARISLLNNALGVTADRSTSGISLLNTTAGTSVLSQNSPSLMLGGNIWDVGSTSSKDFRFSFGIESAGTSNYLNSGLSINMSLNGGTTWTRAMFLTGLGTTFMGTSDYNGAVGFHQQVKFDGASALSIDFTRPLFFNNSTSTFTTRLAPSDVTANQTITLPNKTGTVALLTDIPTPTTYAVGDLLVANSTSTLTNLPDVATTNVLLSGGVGVAPSYGKVALGSAVSGVLPITMGGNGTAASGALGGVMYSTSATINGYTAPNTTATRKFLRETGTGTLGTAPVFDVLVAADVPIMLDNILSKSANYTILTTDYAAGSKSTLDIYVDATAGNVTITGLSAAASAGYTIYITKTDASANTVTFASTSTIFGGVVISTQNQSKQFNSNSVAYYNH